MGRKEEDDMSDWKKKSYASNSREVKALALCEIDPG